MTTVPQGRSLPSPPSHTQHLSRHSTARLLHRQTLGFPHEAQGCTHTRGEAGALGCGACATARMAGGSGKGSGRPGPCLPRPLFFVCLALKSMSRGFYALSIIPTRTLLTHPSYTMQQEPWPLFGLAWAHLSSSSSSSDEQQQHHPPPPLTASSSRSTPPSNHHNLCSVSHARTCLTVPFSSFSRAILPPPRTRLPTTVAVSDRERRRPPATPAPAAPPALAWERWAMNHP
jgi:hypothetical protein